jgi:nicotinamidase-related amidase
VTEPAAWDTAETAAIICDMWDRHWCRSAQRRVAEMAPRVDRLIGALRRRGVLIVHAPSGTMDFYKDHPGRRRCLAAPAVRTRVKLPDWRGPNFRREGEMPIDASDHGCDCKRKCKPHRPWTRQIDTIEIAEGDAIGDKAEVYYLLRRRGIRNVLIMGVHLNFCVLGRPFGIRQMIYLRRRVALVGDLTDTMYNPARPPHVSHFEGTDLMVEHVEKYWCGTITSDQVLGGRPFRFRADRRRRT